MIYIIIPVYNRRDLLKDCLLSFKRQTFKDFHIIVVDDGSTDGTGIMVKEEFPDVCLLEGNGELWWTGSVNKGIRHALNIATKDDYILVINDDLVVKDDYLETLVAHAGNKKNALIGSLVVNIDEPDKILYGGEKYNFYTAKRTLFNKGRKLMDFDKNTLLKVSRLTGRGTLIPVSVFNKIGLYDDKHFKQCGDMEFPVRAKNNGFSLYISYSSIVFNYPDKTAMVNVKKKYKLRDFKKVFFDVRSNNNLRYTFYNCWNPRKNILQFMILFFFALSRKLASFILNVRSL